MCQQYERHLTSLSDSLVGEAVGGASDANVGMGWPGGGS